MWSSKGRFNNAIKDFNPIQWDSNDQGDMTLSILTVIFTIYINIVVFSHWFSGQDVETSGSASIPSTSATAGLLSLSRSTATSATAQIASLLNIPAHLTDCSNSGLRASYAKYQAYISAQSALAKVIADGKWPLQKKPKGEDLIEVFILKSAFFKSYQPHFPHIKDRFPELHRWLVNEEDGPTDTEAWGFQKNTYMFKDLEELFMKGDKGKKKGKESSGKKVEKSGKKVGQAA